IRGMFACPRVGALHTVLDLPRGLPMIVPFLEASDTPRRSFRKENNRHAQWRCHEPDDSVGHRTGLFDAMADGILCQNRGQPSATKPVSQATDSFGNFLTEKVHHDPANRP